MDRLEYLAEIGGSIKCIGVERDHLTKFAIAKPGYYFYKTYRSTIGEVTITHWSSKLEVALSDSDLLADLAVSFDVIISNSKKKPMPQDIRAYFEHSLKQLGILIGQFLSLMEWYDLLAYMEYDLPDRNEFKQTIVRDDL